MTISGFSFDIDILVCAKINKKKIDTISLDFNYESEMSTISFARQIVFMTSDLFKIFGKRVTGKYTK